MAATEIKNARIAATTLGREDHGIMTAWLHLEGYGWGISFGGYAMDQYDKAAKKRVGSAYGIAFLIGVLDAVGVDSWEKVKGQHVRVELEGWGGKALRIGHITKDTWFDPKALADSMRSAEGVEASDAVGQ
jgi:hypothetical protein